MAKGRRQPRVTRTSPSSVTNSGRVGATATRGKDGAAMAQCPSINSYFTTVKKDDISSTPLKATNTGSSQAQKRGLPSIPKLTIKIEKGLLSDHGDLKSVVPQRLISTESVENAPPSETSPLSTPPGSPATSHKSPHIITTSTAASKRNVKKEMPPSAPKRPIIKSHVLTEYFPVRRSNRKTKTAVLREKQKEIEQLVLSEDESGFEVCIFPGKGRGVVAKRSLSAGQVALEYAGDLIDPAEAKRREALYSQNSDVGCYMYYFTFNDKHYCVDATEETGRMGRLLNHSRTHANLKTLIVVVQNLPRLIMVAKRDIQAGEELVYDYGDRSKMSLMYHPWLAE